MSSIARRPIVIGNWKMFTDAREGASLAEAIRRGAEGLDGADLALCPPFTGLSGVAGQLAGSRVALGAQNMHWESEGAYTGEISAKMLLTAGCRYVILGHSERRQFFSETDESINRKVKAALSAGLIPVVCVGETLGQREAGQTEEVIERQIRAGLSGLDGLVAQRMVIAYEPVWAIGTGQVARPEQANAAHRLIRVILAEMGHAGLSEAVRIQYGGSVKPDNAALLMAEPDIDGALVGGASLKADSFLAIARSAAEKNRSTH